MQGVGDGVEGAEAADVACEVGQEGGEAGAKPGQEPPGQQADEFGQVAGVAFGHHLLPQAVQVVHARRGQVVAEDGAFDQVAFDLGGPGVDPFLEQQLGAGVVEVVGADLTRCKG